MSCTVSCCLSSNDESFIVPRHSRRTFPIDIIWVNQMREHWREEIAFLTFIEFVNELEIFFVGIRIIFPKEISTFLVGHGCHTDDCLRLLLVRLFLSTGFDLLLLLLIRRIFMTTFAPMFLECHPIEERLSRPPFISYPKLLPPRPARMMTSFLLVFILCRQHLLFCTIQFIFDDWST